MEGIGFLGVFVALIGAVCVYFGWKGHRAARALRDAAQRWPSAPGTVTGSEVALQGHGKSRYWAPVIRYDYVANGGGHVGDRLRFGYIGTSSRRAAERMLAPYPVGAQVAARFDPDNPADSVLEPDKVTSNLLITAIGGALLTVLGLFIVAAAL